MAYATRHLVHDAYLQLHAHRPFSSAYLTVNNAATVSLEAELLTTFDGRGAAESCHRELNPQTAGSRSDDWGSSCRMLESHRGNCLIGKDPDDPIATSRGSRLGMQLSLLESVKLLRNTKLRSTFCSSRIQKASGLPTPHQH
ncbi:hypothetical protein NUW58_g4915 [Xylaria curta]|uniref:Uncharacterized protein n=1 Tax=Xylaria curta TaxID=42375 RepID=A0ACC1P4C4_9PEZI|nr:hypothetical protein NUW58_g4915 [Xylaria curta]